jgi:hypothetical protein
MPIRGVADRTRLLVASALLALKVVLGLWAAFALLTASADDPQSFFGETITTRQTGLGLFVGALALVTLFVITYLVRFRRWARLAAIAIEVVAIVLAGSRLGSATVPALVSIILSLAVITLLMAAGGRRDLAGD